MELVLRAAEALLATCQEGQKPEILAQLRDIKSRWEETVTYMTHCHRWGQSGGLIATSSDAGGSPCSLPYPLEDPHLSDSSSDSGVTLLQTQGSWEQHVLFGFRPVPLTIDKPNGDGQWTLETQFVVPAVLIGSWMCPLCKGRHKQA